MGGVRPPTPIPPPQEMLSCSAKLWGSSTRPVEPNPAGHDIDAIQCSCGRKIRAAFAEDGGVRHDALQPFDPEGEHTGVDFEKLLL